MCRRASQPHHMAADSHHEQPHTRVWSRQFNAAHGSAAAIDAWVSRNLELFRCCYLQRRRSIHRRFLAARWWRCRPHSHQRGAEAWRAAAAPRWTGRHGDGANVCHCICLWARLRCRRDRRNQQRRSSMPQSRRMAKPTQRANYAAAAAARDDRSRRGQCPCPAQGRQRRRFDQLPPAAIATAESPQRPPQPVLLGSWSCWMLERPLESQSGQRVRPVRRAGQYGRGADGGCQGLRQWR